MLPHTAHYDQLIMMSYRTPERSQREPKMRDFRENMPAVQHG